MTLKHFSLLNKAKQQDIVLRNGMFLTERTDGPFKIMLYQLEDFYVEVFIFNLYDKVALFRAFDSIDELEPYFEQINVSGLLQEVLS